ncbi:hypothetical protein F5Y15DRAFT_302832 [Xylariaceae sp. FL0016]|nr:hypothetical protein F5Y15DRAFT_302832 [Xylariaceae sp. FL0016]
MPLLYQFLDIISYYLMSWMFLIQLNRHHPDPQTLNDISFLTSLWSLCLRTKGGALQIVTAQQAGEMLFRGHSFITLTTIKSPLLAVCELQFPVSPNALSKSQITMASIELRVMTHAHLNGERFRVAIIHINPQDFTPAESLRRPGFRDVPRTHKLQITTAHKLLQELDLWTPIRDKTQHCHGEIAAMLCTSYDTDDKKTELSGGVGLGEREEDAVPKIGTVEDLIRAFWEYTGVGEEAMCQPMEKKVASVKRRTVLEIEKKILSIEGKIPFPYDGRPSRLKQIFSR